MGINDREGWAVGAMAAHTLSFWVITASFELAFAINVICTYG